MSRATTYKLPETKRIVIDTGEGWYRFAYSRWTKLPAAQQHNLATPPGRGDKFFTARQLGILGVKLQ